MKLTLGMGIFVRVETERSGRGGNCRGGRAVLPGCDLVPGCKEVLGLRPQHSSRSMELNVLTGTTEGIS